jgi:hypothetical protein
MGTPLNFWITQLCLDLWKLWPSKYRGLPVKKNFTTQLPHLLPPKNSPYKKPVKKLLVHVQNYQTELHWIPSFLPWESHSILINSWECVWFLGYRSTMMGFRMFRVAQNLNKVGNHHQTVPLFSYYRNGFLLMLLLHSIEELYTFLPLAILPRSN